MAKPKIKINNLDENKTPTVKEKKRRNKRSNFFITINTNQKINPHSKEYENLNNSFKKSLNEIYNNIKDYINISQKDDSFDNNVEDVNIDSATKYGPKNNSVHTHININLKHNTLLKLDYSKIKKKICEDLNLKNIYMNSKLYNNNAMNLKDYINKIYE